MIAHETLALEMFVREIPILEVLACEILTLEIPTLKALASEILILKWARKVIRAVKPDSLFFLATIA
jgi:hypothetical protein